MAKTKQQLAWCIVRLGEDLNWWVDEISDEIHWDIEGLSIIDPRQMNYILDLIDPLNDYGFDGNLLESAFFPFQIDKDLGEGRVQLARANESLLDTEEQLFALPNLIDEETGPYADFIDHITKLRVKLLNDTIDFEQQLTMDEIEEEIREDQNSTFLEGSSVHVFNEIVNILEYVPAGYESDDEDEVKARGIEEEVTDQFPDIDEKEEEQLNKDETLRWEEEEENGGEEEGEAAEDLDDLEDDDDFEEEEDELEEDPEFEDDEEELRSRPRGPKK